ncbi:T9SS-dependent choice-of-anchor J family protein [Seonamhaeicola maritimus]|uniref:T9SS-dependent choice-of-anchor J family protein n=1 Tax=Seonamhaeicola maritimus TaxID=2591822 RepID=UPI002495A535|nr:choice-of-anchor J domain-containing protein [Seonamhaeicola maritimus]
MKKITFILLVLCFSLNSKAQCDSNLPVMENFDSDTIGVCWQIDDQDGDGNDWMWWQYSQSTGGHKVIASYSVYTSTGPLTPDNWIISYAIDLTSFNTSEDIELSWKARAELSYLAHEYYTVYAATSSQIADFKSSSVQRGEYMDEIGGAGVFVTRTLDLSSLAGNVVYIAFRHHNSTNQSDINIDDVSISTSLLSNTDFDTKSFKHFYDLDRDNLILKSETKLDNINIFNILGQQVLFRSLSKTQEAVDVSNLKDGIYIAKVEVENTFQTVKFIKR